MRDFRDAKAMAQTLRDALTTKSVTMTHSESLELVSRLFGFRDWNTLSARIQSVAQAAATEGSATSADIALPVAPLRDMVFFPQMVSPIYIGREKTRRAVEHAMAHDGRILVVTQRLSADDTITADRLYDAGVTARILDLTPFEDGTSRAIIKVLERSSIARWSDGEFLSANVTVIEETSGLDPKSAELARTVLERLETYFNITFSSPPAPYARLPLIRDPARFADAVVPLLPIALSEKQEFLETGDVITRLEKILAIVTSQRRAA